MFDDSILQVAVGIVPAALLFLFAGLFSKRHKVRNLIFAASLFIIACIVGVPRLFTILVPQMHGYDEIKLVLAVSDEERPDIAESMLDYLGSDTDISRGVLESSSDALYRTAARYIVYADSVHNAYLNGEPIKLDNIIDQSAGLDTFLLEHPEFTGDRLMLASRTRLRLLSGNYAGIAADIGDNPDFCDLMVASELYMRHLIDDNDFEDGWADKVAEKFRDVYEKMSEIFTAGLSFDSSEERNEALFAFRAIENVATNPPLGRIREELLSYATRVDATDFALIYLQLYKIELALGDIVKASEYLEYTRDSEYYPVPADPDDAAAAPGDAPSGADDESGAYAGEEEDGEYRAEGEGRADDSDGAKEYEPYSQVLVFAGRVYESLLAVRIDDSPAERDYFNDAIDLIVAILPLIVAFIVALAVSIAILVVFRGYDKVEDKRMYVLGTTRTGSMVLGAVMLLGIVFFSWQFASVRGSSEGEAFFAIARESVDKGFEVLRDVALYSRAPIFFAAAFGVFVLAIVVLNVVIAAIKRKIEQPRSAINGAGRPSFMASSGITYSVPPELALDNNENEKE